MTGEEAISRLQALVQANEEAGHSDASFLRALLPLARTGLLVERELPKCGEALRFTHYPKGHACGTGVHIARESFEAYDEVLLAHGPTLTAAVEAALKGQQ